MRTVWLSAVLLAGCVGELPHEDPTVAARTGACADLEGMTFRSVAPGECGLPPDGIATCPWHITFASHDDTTSRFTWGHSDVSEQGFVTCNGDSITSDATTAYDGHVDANLDLMWDGVAYAIAPPP